MCSPFTAACHPLARFDKAAGRSLRWLKPLPLLLCEVALMVEHPQIQVPLSLAGELLEDLALADGLHDGHVHRVVPVNDGFLLGDIPLEVEAHEVAVHGNVLKHAVEAVGDGEADARLGTQVVEAGALEEVDLLPKDDEVLGLEIRGDVHLGGTLADLCFDELLPLLAGYRDAVMPIHDKIDLPHFIEHHR